MNQEVREIRDYLCKELNWSEYLYPVKFGYIDDRRVNDSTIGESDEYDEHDVSEETEVINIEKSTGARMVSCTYVAVWKYHDSAFGGAKSIFDRTRYLFG